MSLKRSFHAIQANDADLFANEQRHSFLKDLKDVATQVRLSRKNQELAYVRMKNELIETSKRVDFLGLEHELNSAREEKVLLPRKRGQQDVGKLEVATSVKHISLSLSLNDCKLLETNIRDSKAREELELLIDQTEELKISLKRMTDKNSHVANVIRKIGLRLRAERVLKSLGKMQFNAVQCIASKVLFPMVEDLDMPVYLRLTVGCITTLVRLDPNRRNVKHWRETLQDYHETLSLKSKEVVQLWRILQIASLRDREIIWPRYQRLLGIADERKLALDFIEAALTSGLSIKRVFKPFWPDNYWCRRAFKKVITPEERRLCSLQADELQVSILPPPEWRQWLDSLEGNDDILVKHIQRQSKPIVPVAINKDQLDYVVLRNGKRMKREVIVIDHDNTDFEKSELVDNFVIKLRDDNTLDSELDSEYDEDVDSQSVCINRPVFNASAAGHQKLTDFQNIDDTDSIIEFNHASEQHFDI